MAAEQKLKEEQSGGGLLGVRLQAEVRSEVMASV